MMMATLPLSPFILLVLWLGFSISDWLGGLKSNRPASHHFGRKGREV